MSQSWMDGLRVESTTTEQPARPRVVPIRADAPAPDRIDAGAGDALSSALSGPVRETVGAVPAIAPAVTVAPMRGWRGLVFAASGHRINPGAAELRRRASDALLNAPISGTHHVAVVGAKGGVGRGTVAVALGHAFALHRRDRVVSLDGAGGLASRIVEQRFSHGSSTPTITDLLAVEDSARYPEVRTCLLEASSGLQMLATARARDVTGGVSETDFTTAIDVLSGHYQLLITACSAGLTGMNQSIIGLADTVLVPTTGTEQSTTKALATLGWLDANQFGARPIVVLSRTNPDKKSGMTVEQVRDLFAGRVRDVVAVPYDRHLATGPQVVWEQMHPRTQMAYRVLAERVAEGFSAGASMGEVSW